MIVRHAWMGNKQSAKDGSSDTLASVLSGDEFEEMEKNEIRLRARLGTLDSGELPSLVSMRHVLGVREGDFDVIAVDVEGIAVPSDPLELERSVLMISKVCRACTHSVLTAAQLTGPSSFDASPMLPRRIL